MASRRRGRPKTVPTPPVADKANSFDSIGSAAAVISQQAGKYISLNVERRVLREECKTHYSDGSVVESVRTYVANPQQSVWVPNDQSK